MVEVGAGGSGRTDGEGGAGATGVAVGAGSAARGLLLRVMRLGAGLIGAIALVGAAVGWFVAGGEGVASALIGAGMALLFVTFTALSVWFGSRLPLGGFFAVVMGGWLLKLVGFMVLVVALKGVDFVVGPILFGTLVAAILGSLALDGVMVMRTKIPTVNG